MNKTLHALALGLALLAGAGTAWGATPPPADTTTIRIGGHDVPVVKGGLYDRFRSNPPLSVIATEAPDVDLSWFRGLEKQKVDMGFESWSPNFYYRNSRVTAIYTADLARLRELMPEGVLEEVQPLQVWPGRGLVALTAYAYEYCDNDSYNEIGLSVVTTRPGARGWGPFSLAAQSRANDFWGHVLKMPVDTELARVRGVVGYNLPKWLTKINYRDDGDTVVVEIFDSETGKLDVTMQTRALDVSSSKESLIRNSFTNVDHDGRPTTGYSVSRQLRHASTSSSDTVELTLTDGSFSRFIESLDLGRMVRYEYVPDFQAALYAPELLAPAASAQSAP
ncbi:hypothetical protein LDO26_10195 [Luteimonas sp. BDR2-5]|uniref:hypothetical protein n=1 Tax=Proluteimonas luteida TaxID=2878685 RepID=UPI001E3F629D|nr:hypothetical protein [Luteimonas sp. BDR2-5]MCD9028576.1 hypothetical protein [Luteimonas sp. BDR2-5]